MKPPKFAYHAPVQLDDAVQLLARYAGNARVLSGGQSLIPMLNFRLLAPEALVDLRRVPGLAKIRIVQDTLCIGAMTRQRAAENSDLVLQHLPTVPNPTEVKIREAMSAVICRCTGYQGIVNAVAAAAKAGQSGARNANNTR